MLVVIHTASPENSVEQLALLQHIQAVFLSVNVSANLFTAWLVAVFDRVVTCTWLSLIMTPPDSAEKAWSTCLRDRYPPLVVDVAYSHSWANISFYDKITIHQCLIADFYIAMFGNLKCIIKPYPNVEYCLKNKHEISKKHLLSDKQVYNLAVKLTKQCLFHNILTNHPNSRRELIYFQIVLMLVIPLTYIISPDSRQGREI